MVKPFLESLRQRHDVREAYLFGSFAGNMAKDYSEVDLAVVLGSMEKSQDSLFDESFEIFHEAQEYNSLLEVVCFDKEEFHRDGGILVRKIDLITVAPIFPYPKDLQGPSAVLIVEKDATPKIPSRCDLVKGRWEKDSQPAGHRLNGSNW